MAYGNLVNCIKVKQGEDRDAVAARLWNTWEEDRGADGEWVFDLHNIDDFRIMVDLYGLDNAVDMYNKGRFWMAGWQFSYNGKNVSNTSRVSAWNVTYDNTINSHDLACYIAERWETLRNEGWSVKSFGELYSDLDIRKFMGIKREFNWVCSSDDGAYFKYSPESFDNERDCYNAMRSEALEKVKWNTQFDEDFNDMGEGDSIGYSMSFSPKMITHFSYSGHYTYLMVEGDPFSKEVQDELAEKFAIDTEGAINTEEIMRLIAISTRNQRYERESF